MAKFVVWHERIQRIMTTVEAESKEEAMEKYDKYADSDFDKVDRRFDDTDPVYDTYCEEYTSDERLVTLAQSEFVREIITLEEAKARD